MTIANEAREFSQGTNQTVTLTIPIGSSGYDHTDVDTATLMLARYGAAVLTKTLAAAEITAATVGTDIVLTCNLVPADTSSLSGVFAVEWAVTIDGSIDQRAVSSWTITERAAT